MNIIQIPVGQVWPEHAEHQIIYSEHGRTDYLLISLEKMDDYDPMPGEYDNRPVNGDISDTEIWCRDCGVVLTIPEGDS